MANILVIGDLILDHYIWGNCDRISPEAPVQVVDVKKESLNLGGACNVASNLVCLESSVWICGVAGCDSAGDKLKQELEAQNIKTSGIFFDKTRPTTQKSRIIAGHQQVVRVDREEKAVISQEASRFISNFAKDLIKDSSINCIVLSDYQKGVLSASLTQDLIELARENKIKILADPKGKDYSKYKGATLLTPNKKEAQEATGILIKDSNSLESCIDKLKEICELEISLITLSEDGIAFKDSKDGILNKIPTIAREVFDVTGAGDTVIAALAFMLSQNMPIMQSVYFANAAAAVVVSKIGSAVATKQEIYAYLKRNNLLDSSLVNKQFLEIFGDFRESRFKSQMQRILKQKKPESYKNKQIKESEFLEFLEMLKGLQNDGLKIVFTNGCFDILHLGHIEYLNAARDLGDVLIVGLNSDDSIRRLKGSKRPINEESERVAMLCALACVDFVITFSEDTPLKLIEQIAPDILVKGADYENKEVVGSNIAKEVRLISFVDGKSTTNLIQKIQNLKD